MIGAGLKKCMPMTSCGREVALASEMIGRLEVVVARIVPGLQISSRFSKRVVLIARSSAMASTTISTRGEVVERGGAGEPAQHLGLLLLGGPAALDLLVEVAGDRGRARRRPCPGERPTYSTSYPLLAKTSTMPAAMVPVPTTPTVRMSCRSSGQVVGRRGVVVGDHDRAVGALVGVEAAAGLAAQQAGGDHLLEDRGRRVQPVAALAVHRLEDLVRRVEADQVEQRQRAHRVAAAEAHGGVDVLAGGVLALVHRRPRG